MSGLEELLDGFFRSTAWVRSLAFALISFTCAWRAMRATPFRNVLIWVCVLTAIYVVAVPLSTYFPHLSLYTRTVTTPITLILAWHCIQYLRYDPPKWWEHRRHPYEPEQDR